MIIWMSLDPTQFDSSRKDWLERKESVIGMVGAQRFYDSKNLVNIGMLEEQRRAGVKHYFLSN